MDLVRDSDHHATLPLRTLGHEGRGHLDYASVVGVEHFLQSVFGCLLQVSRVSIVGPILASDLTPEEELDIQLSLDHDRINYALLDRLLIGIERLVTSDVSPHLAALSTDSYGADFPGLWVHVDDIPVH